MNSIWVVVPTMVSRDDLKRVINSFGGYWNQEPTLDEGVIERKKAAIYVSLHSMQTQSCYYESEIQEVQKRLGQAPKTIISVQIGHGIGSEELAIEFAEQVSRDWNGYIEHGTQKE